MSDYKYTIIKGKKKAQELSEKLASELGFLWRAWPVPQAGIREGTYMVNAYISIWDHTSFYIGHPSLHVVPTTDHKYVAWFVGIRPDFNYKAVCSTPLSAVRAVINKLTQHPKDWADPRWSNKRCDCPDKARILRVYRHTMEVLELSNTSSYILPILLMVVILLSCLWVIT